jgi:hypothetical protein
MEFIEGLRRCTSHFLSATFATRSLIDVAYTKGDKMIRALKQRSALALALAILLAATRVQGATYKASIISSVGYESPTATPVSGSAIVGLANPTTGGLSAILWNGTNDTVVDLNPGPDWASQAEGVSVNDQVGHGNSALSGGNEHALLWHGTAASYVDLNPTGFSNSYAYGVSGNNQVGQGWGDLTGGPSHALLWHSTANSVVDLHPAGFIGSFAAGVFADEIVGSGQTPQGTRALLWHGTADNFVNLHPAAYPESFASDVWQDSQVGTAVLSSAPNGARHALLWHGSAASVVDLHLAGFHQTDANAIADGLEVGMGKGSATAGQQHALLWSGSAASVLDLHPFLAGLGTTFVSSVATDIDDNGTIVDSASDGLKLYAV